MRKKRDLYQGLEEQYVIVPLVLETYDSSQCQVSRTTLSPAGTRIQTPSPAAIATCSVPYGRGNCSLIDRVQDSAAAGNSYLRSSASADEDS